MISAPATAAAVLAPGFLAAFWLVFRKTSPSESDNFESISINILRKKLPYDLTEWRTHSRYISSWNHLRRFLAGYGYRLWPFDSLNPSKSGVLAPPGWEYGNPNGFLYAPSQVIPVSTQEDQSPSDLHSSTGLGTELGLGALATPRRTLWPARHDHGDVVIRVLSAGGDGLRSLKILRQISTVPETLNRSNHALPLFREIVLKDVILGVFPRVTTSLAEVFVSNTFVAEMDLLEIFAQCLEGLDFLHQNLIAHLNATFDNFLIDYIPFSHPQVRPLTGRPRVYITNFDRAVSFPRNTPATERFCFGDHFFLHQTQQDQVQEPAKDTYLARKRALESAQEGNEQDGKKILQMPVRPPEIVDHRHRFSPFPVDCWQLASGVLALEPESTEENDNSRFISIKPIHELFHTMASADPTCRPSALDALISLQRILTPS